MGNKCGAHTVPGLKNKNSSSRLIEVKLVEVPESNITKPLFVVELSISILSFPFFISIPYDIIKTL